MQADEIEEGLDAIPSLPSQKDDEFRPFVRRLPEWNFWLSSTRAVSIAIVCSLFEAFDVPVYWPILVLYFCILFALTMRRQIQYVYTHLQRTLVADEIPFDRHMIKYKYIPFDFGRKTRYGNARAI